MEDGKYVILYVDDDPDFLMTVRTILEKNDYVMIEAPTAEDGLRVFKEQRPDLVIVNSVIRPSGEDEPIKVDWRLTGEGEAFKILDIVAEGVSLAITYRQEYASVLSKEGGNVDALTARLREMVASGALASPQ